MLEQNKKIALAWFEAFNAHDLEKLLSLYHDEAQHFSPKLKIRKPETLGFVKGKTALREWWRECFERLPSLNYELVALTADDKQVFMEYKRHVDDEDTLSVGEVLEIKNDLIIASRVYHG